jgi:hypothetical protein
MDLEQKQVDEAEIGMTVDAEHTETDAEGREIRVIERATVVEVSLVRRDPRAQRPPRGNQGPR